ncbi:hypothetical protein CJF42_14500 [Pseudoalteromonas sp. NBT06-2]|uniref:YfiR family protein n=1 Tax=Pseudoalteromonas sp. NBT06-2 TaxID=2025950 RepID=UPI000BA7DEEF|nr:YfiR family protein [Pseudoalteromonas sp. NBT06-2]PAJ73698.1 hypothetical protein CJF42_14500 [Pseudoalteromonas sp. NBT06-2]
MMKAINLFLNNALFIAMFCSLFLISKSTYAENITKVRSAFIFKISKFMTFPPPTLNNMKLCFFNEKKGPEKFLFSKKSLKSQTPPISIVFFDDIEKIMELNHSCNIIYLNENIQSKIDKQWINKISSKVVVIGETLEFLDLGGLVALIQKGNKVRIFINKAKLSQSQVKIESRLLALVKFHPQ